MSDEIIYLRVWPEYYSSGIWHVTHPRQVYAGGFVDYKDLGLSKGLALAFKAWQSWHDSSPFLGEEGHDRFQKSNFDEVGRELAAALRSELPAHYQVDYCLDVKQDPEFNPPIRQRTLAA